MHEFLDFDIKEFNELLYRKMIKAEKIALKNVGRWILHKLILSLTFIEKMKFLQLFPLLLVLFGFFPFENLVYAGTDNSKNYKVLSSNSKNLSIANVKYYLKEGDKFIKNGDFDKAKDSYLDARKLAKQLASFYSDLNSSFKGVDARIPIEMQRKGKETLQILAESNERLVSLYLKTDKPEVALPLLVETIRIMSPNSPEGKEAYEKLIQLGFVETKYKG